MPSLRERSRSLVVDVREEFGADFVAPAIRANALYEGKYPLISSLSRPIIVKHLVAAARQHGADAIAHGCTGKGNDQVRFEVSSRALAPDLEVIAPVRTWGFTRDDSIDYAKRYGIPISATKASPYSVDQNLWGRTVECGILEDPWVMPPADVYELTVPKAAGGEALEVVVGFEAGLPVSVDGRRLALHELVPALDALVGPYGFGRIDMIENRRVGIKSREIYECPGALALLMAHQDLEGMTLERDVAHEKSRLEPRWAELVYDGLWYSPLKASLDAFFARVPAPCDRRGPPALRARDRSWRSRLLLRRGQEEPGRPLRPRPGHLLGRRPLPPRGRRRLRAHLRARHRDLGEQAGPGRLTRALAVSPVGARPHRSGARRGETAPPGDEFAGERNSSLRHTVRPSSPGCPGVNDCAGSSQRPFASRMEAACAENRKRGFAMGRSSTESANSFHRCQ